jgi:hypothetical protein
MKASRVLIVCLLLSCRTATAQVGTWQVQITRVGSTKETGIGYVTLSEDGSVTGYSITTLGKGCPKTIKRPLNGFAGLPTKDLQERRLGWECAMLMDSGCRRTTLRQ